LSREKGESLSATLYVFVFAEALRERPGTLPIADFQDLINEMAHFPQSPCIRGNLAACLLAARCSALSSNE
jgi:hypothetical protein